MYMFLQRLYGTPLSVLPITPATDSDLFGACMCGLFSVCSNLPATTYLPTTLPTTSPFSELFVLFRHCGNELSVATHAATAHPVRGVRVVIPRVCDTCHYACVTIAGATWPAFRVYAS